MIPKFEIFKGKDRQWYFHLRARNQKVIAQSEGYKTKRGAQRGIAAVCTAARTAVVVEINSR